MMNSTSSVDMVCEATNNYSCSRFTTFDELSLAFDKHHQNTLNIAMHMFTTPLGFIGLLGLLRAFTKGSTASVALCCFYLTILMPMVPMGVFIGTALMCMMIALLARNITHSGVALSLIILGYLLQDLSHLATNETTYQSTYSNGGEVTLIFSLKSKVNHSISIDRSDEPVFLVKNAG